MLLFPSLREVFVYFLLFAQLCVDRCSTHSTTFEIKRHYVTVEEEHMKCRMCAQTRLFDNVTIFLTQQCAAADQTNWMMRIHQLKSEMDVEQQGRVGDDPKKRTRMRLQDGR